MDMLLALDLHSSCSLKHLRRRGHSYELELLERKHVV